MAKLSLIKPIIALAALLTLGAGCEAYRKFTAGSPTPNVPQPNVAATTSAIQKPPDQTQKPIEKPAEKPTQWPRNKTVEQSYLAANYRVLRVLKNPKANMFVVVATDKRDEDCDNTKNTCQNDTICGSMYSQPNCYFFYEPDYVYGVDAKSRLIAKTTKTGAVTLDSPMTFVSADLLQFEAGDGDAGWSVKNTWQINLKTGEVKLVKKEEKIQETP